MYSIMLKSKLHNATITRVQMDYEGSLEVDSDLLNLVKIRPYEKILVTNLNNGNRFETYAMAGERGSRAICLNGAAAHLGAVGDRIIIFAFSSVPTEIVEEHQPLIQVLDEHNKPVGGLKDTF